MKNNFKVSKRNADLALLLVLMLFASIASILPSVQAQATSVTTHAFIAAAPNPVGVGESVLVTSWLAEYPPAINNIPIVYWKYTVTITDPSGNIQTKSVTSDAIGGATFSFTPSAAGTWTIKMDFPATTVSNLNYIADTSNIFSLTVTTAQTPYYSSAPLPTGFWQRPVEAENREWASISGNWLGMAGLGSPGQVSTYDRYGKFNPYSTAPNTPHIVWTKPIVPGGLVGGEYGTNYYYSGNSYEIRGFPDIILNGVLYYNLPAGDWPSGGGFVAVDLRTGQQLYKHDGTITFAQILEFDSLNQHGAIPVLWSIPQNTRYSINMPANSFQARDPATGDVISTIANCQLAAAFGQITGSFVKGPNGEILEYVLQGTPANRLTLWNSTKCFTNQNPPGFLFAAGGVGYGPDYFRMQPGATYQWAPGVEWNVSIPSLPAGLGIMKMTDDVIVTEIVVSGNSTLGARFGPLYEIEAGFSTHDGHNMWVQNRTGEDMIAGGEATFGYAVGAGVYAVFKQETEQWFGYDINTGNRIWKTDPYPNPWGSFYTTIGDGPAYVAYGKLYATAYDGTLHCYDMTNGKTLWQTYIGSSGTETPYGQYPFFGSFVIADGKVYVGNGEHSINSPPYRGERFWCFDANTGNVLWSIFGYMQNPIVADGYLVSVPNAYDMQAYTFGKGKTSTTVSLSPGVVAAGSEVTITGTVYDISPSAPANTPAVSKDSMEQFMEYLYMQKPQPTNTTGVSLALVAISDTSHNGTESSTTIGTITTDSTGFYATHWQVPTTPGTYKIVANFAGDDSYWTSSAIGAITVVGAAPTPASANDVASAVVAQLPVQTPVPTAPSASDVANQVVAQLPAEDNTLLYAAIAIIIIAVLIGIVNLAVLMMRRKQAA